MPQQPGQIIDIAGWRPDEDFPIFPVGSKPKRAVFSPDSGVYPFIVPDHRYLFKISSGWRVHNTGRR
jgi:hypothetical protein